MDQDKTLVTDPPRGRSLFLRSGLVLLVVFAATAVELWTGGWVQSLAHVTVAGWVGWTAFYGYRRAQLYKDGWLDGRGQMITAMSEAMGRGLTLDDWLAGEWERDCAVMGIRPVPIAPEEDQ
jgi:hypothetical protein